MADYGLNPTLQGSAMAGGIDPNTGTTFGENMAKNATSQAYNEQLVNQAVEKSKQSKIQTQVEQKQLDAQTYLAEKGMMPKDQAMVQLKIALMIEQRPEEEIAAVMKEAEDNLPDVIDGRGLYQWWTTIQLPKYKTKEVFATAADAAGTPRDPFGQHVVEGRGYMIDANDTWHLSGLSKAETEAAAKANHPAKSSGADEWHTESVTKTGVPIQVNKLGQYRFGDTSTINNEAMYPKNSTMATSAARNSAETAGNVIAKIQRARELIAEADAKGYIGPVGGRFGEFLAGKVGSTGNAESDTALGELRALVTFLKSGAMKVHFGSRGGQQMYEKFTDAFDPSKQSAAVLNGELNSIEGFMKGYADAPGIPEHQSNPVPPPVKHGRRLTDQPAAAPAATPAKAPVKASLGQKTTAKGTVYSVEE